MSEIATIASVFSETRVSKLAELVRRWRGDAHASYKSWFLWEERLKNFRSIRRGLDQVVREIEAGAFGTAYRGSSLETVVGSIAEQRQIFKGADHAFLWKPKLRIPDIYENRDNQIAFGRFLKTCCCVSEEESVLSAIRDLDAKKIKGLGPAAANLLYFLHPQIVPPFNTAIVNGYNSLTGAKVKLGKWDEFLTMRQGILRLNRSLKDLLSVDLGAIGGLLFDIGSERYQAPPLEDDGDATAAWKADLEKVRAESENSKVEKYEKDERSHTEVQGWLRDIGKALGFGVWIASNDRTRSYLGGALGDGCLTTLPLVIDARTLETVRLIDVLWINPGDNTITAAFEVEHTTSIYSGILRLLDLAESGGTKGLFLVAPDGREADVRAQLHRPAFRKVADLDVKFLPYTELEKNREAIARFGSGIKPIDVIARILL